MDKDNKKRKTAFEKPVAEIRRFGVRDVIRTSPINLPGDPYDGYDEDEEY